METITSPRVSVVVPCFNLGRYLDEAVDSVLAQSFQDFEILVVDDGSTDPATRDLLATYDKPKTRVLRSENRGLPGARNLGIAHTTGPLLCMLDADDHLESALFEKSVAALDADPGLTFVSHWLRTFGDETWEWKPERWDFPALLDANTVNGAALVRREAILDVGGFDESMRDGFGDWDLWITLVERGYRGRILPEVLFNFRRWADSMSRIMLRQEGHPALYARLVDKHVDTYRAHLPALVSRRARDIARLRGQIHDLELEYHDGLAPELAKARDDVSGLERRTIEGPTEGERAALAEVSALHQSWSWRVTAPLRAVYDLLRGLGRGRNGS